MRKFWLLSIAFLALAGGAGWWFRGTLAGLWNAAFIGVQLRGQAKLQPDPETYAVLATDLSRWRAELAKRHLSARDDAQRRAVENDARIVLEAALPAMMQCWLGTPWDFNGTAKTPGEGRIACGYFVATVLKDAGFLVDRYKLAQQPSENILRSFLPRNSCVLTVGKNYQKFAAELDASEPGVYVVGLDTHVAFILVSGDGFRFIHASGSRPWCVVDENRDEAEVLKRSNWRMLGHITADREVLKRWLKAEKIVVRDA
ncbi:MAG: hypothetical protein WED15_06930 [Akkermansiaceae bacterium]